MTISPPSIPLSQKSAIGIISICVLVVGLLTASGVVAGAADEYDNAEWNEYYEGNPDWVPPAPPSGASDQFSTKGYGYLWNGMEHHELGDNETVPLKDVPQEYEYIRRSSYSGYTFAEPFEEPAIWNRNTEATFSGGGSSTSIHPPGVSTQSSSDIEDAYIDIAAVSPSTITHEGDGNTVHYVPDEDGELLVASDFREDIPEDEHYTYTKFLYSVSSTSSSRIELSSEGIDITADTSSSTGGSTASYYQLPQDDTKIIAKQTFEVTYTETVLDRHCVEYAAIDGEKVCVDFHWDVADTNTYSDTITVTDTIDVQTYAPDSTPTIRMVDTPGTTEIQFEIKVEGPWSYMDLDGVGTVKGSHNFFAQRDQEYDTFVQSTDSGTSDEYRSEFTPVQTVAYPARESPTFSGFATATTSGFAYRVNSSTTVSPPTLDPALGITSPDSGNTQEFTYPETTKLSTELTYYEFVLENAQLGPMVATEDTTDVEIVDRRTLEQLTLDLDVDQISGTGGEMYEVTVTATDGDGYPVSTETANGQIYLSSGDVVNTNYQGEATVTVDGENHDDVTAYYDVPVNADSSWLERTYYSTSTSTYLRPTPDLWISIQTLVNEGLFPIAVWGGSIIGVILLLIYSATGHIPLRRP